MQPEYEQPPLPFEDEVLVLLYKDTFLAGIADKFPEQMKKTVHHLWNQAFWKARGLGFVLKRNNVTMNVIDDLLHIQLRAEAERT